MDLTPLVIMFVGMLLGKLLSKVDNFIKFSIKGTEYSIFLLLFLLGTGIGNNDTILQNFDKIGISVIWITSMSILGSITVSYFVYNIWFKKNER